jgi:hypothetical protein
LIVGPAAPAAPRYFTFDFNFAGTTGWRILSMKFASIPGAMAIMGFGLSQSRAQHKLLTSQT